VNFYFLGNTAQILRARAYNNNIIINPIYIASYGRNFRELNS